VIDAMRRAKALGPCRTSDADFLCDERWRQRFGEGIAEAHVRRDGDFLRRRGMRRKSEIQGVDSGAAKQQRAKRQTSKGRAVNRR